jgi:hypothetical protein
LIEQEAMKPGEIPNGGFTASELSGNFPGFMISCSAPTSAGEKFACARPGSN